MVRLYLKCSEELSLDYLGLRMPSPGNRLPLNAIGHAGPGGPPPLPNAYRPPGMPPAMSPSMNQPGPRMYMNNSPGVTIPHFTMSCLTVSHS